MFIKDWGTAALALGLWLFASAGAEAGFVFKMEQTVAGVVLTGSGKINTAGLTLGGSNSFPVAGIVPSLGVVRGGVSTYDLEEWTGITGPTSFGSAANHNTTGFGDPIAVVGGSNGFLLLHEDYASGDWIENTATFAGATYALLGVTPGTYVWTWGRADQADSLTLEIIEPNAVPEPMSVVLFSAGLLCLAVVHLRARRAAVVAAQHPHGIVNPVQSGTTGGGPGVRAISRH